MSAELLQHLSVHPEAGDHRPWPRFHLTAAGWSDLLAALAQSSAWSLLGLWADAGLVHLALRDDFNGTIAVASVAPQDGRYEAVSPWRPAAVRLERTIRDLHGYVAEGAEDMRPWLDHGRWPREQPLNPDAPTPPTDKQTVHDYAFLPVEGHGLTHQIPVGPVHAGIIEPGHFRFTCNGETVVRLEEKLGWVHKGIEAHLAGRTVAEAAPIIARVSGDSAVAYGIAFARAVEAARIVEVPARAAWLRGVMAEIERVANHLGDIGAICNDAAFAFMLMQCGSLRERLLRAAARAFGHRLMFDVVIPGGVARDIAPDGRREILEAVKVIRPRFAELIHIYDEKPSLSDRVVATGVVSGGLVNRFGAGGYVGRAALRAVDARKAAPYPPYDDLDFEVPTLGEGDVNARVWVRIKEVEASLSLIEAMLTRLPDGDLVAPIPPGPGEGMALVEGFRGEILIWLRLDAAGRIARCHPRDPSWFTWPLLEAAIEGNIVADFPLCNKSFNCSYSGVDL